MVTGCNLWGRCWRPLVPMVLSQAISGLALAHDPHDVIDDIEISHFQDGGVAIFIINDHENLQLSVDRGMSWRQLSTGLDNRYSLLDIALAPDWSRSGFMLVGTDGDGVYRSLDGGQTWSASSRQPERLRELLILQDDGAQHVALAAAVGGGLYLSEDQGSRWASVLGPEHTITALALREDGSVLAGDAQGWLWRSEDNGRSWEKVGEVADAGAVSALAFAAGGRRLLVGTARRGVYAGSLEGAANLQPSSEGLGEAGVVSIAVSPTSAAKQVILASTWRAGVFSSSDGGITWRSASEGLTSDHQAEQLAFYAPHFQEIRFAPGSEDSPTILVAGFDGLFHSSDLGGSWAELQTVTPERILGLATTTAASGKTVLLLTTYGAGVYRAEEPLTDWRIGNYGLVKARVAHPTFTSAYPGTPVAFATSDEGDELLRSDDGGLSWDPVRLAPSRLAELRIKALRALNRIGLPASISVDLIDPSDLARAHPKGIALSPTFDRDRTLYVSTRHRGLYRSQDAGQSVEQIDGDLETLWPIVVGQDAAGSAHLFTTAREQGVFRSRDGGVRWQPINQGLDFIAAWNDQTLDERSRKELGRSKFYSLHLAVSPAYAADGTVFVAGGPGLYRSSSQGERWERLSAPALGPDPQIQTLALSPAFDQDGVMLVSVKGRGLFRSNDRGQSFVAVAPHLLEAHHQPALIAFGPRYPTEPHIYVASVDDLWRSIDDGRTWQLIQRPIRYEDLRAGYQLLDSGWESQRRPGSSLGRVATTDIDGARASLSFVGTGFRLIGPRGPDLGGAWIELDGRRIGRVDPSGSREAAEDQVLFEVQGLLRRRYELAIVADVQEGRPLVVDAVDVLGSRPAHRNYRTERRRAGMAVDG